MTIQSAPVSFNTRPGVVHDHDDIVHVFGHSRLIPDASAAIGSFDWPVRRRCYDGVHGSRLQFPKLIECAARNELTPSRCRVSVLSDTERVRDRPAFIATPTWMRISESP